ncbi:MAG: DUF2066 domain-containing protein [Halioglobus sp.]
MEFSLSYANTAPLRSLALLLRRGAGTMRVCLFAEMTVFTIFLPTSWTRIIACLMLVCSSTQAVVVDNLYEAEVPVADHGAEALEQASLLALQQVFIKVSGSVNVLENPVILTELEKARSYVQQYSYTRDQDADGDLSAKFEFDGAVISKLVVSSGAPFWTANRPTVLVWVVVQNASGKQFVGADSQSAVLDAIQKSFSTRGVPLRVPLLDLEDTAALKVDEVWRLRAPPLLAASVRYGVQDILAGRITELSTGEWLGDWAYISGNNRVDRTASADSIDTFMNSGASLVAEQMARNYSVAASQADVGGVLMSVRGVNQYSDYAKIVSWLESLELIQHANVEEIEGDEIRLRLTAQAQASRLRKIIELNRKLSPLSNTSGSQQLRYQWKN